jgi:Fe-S cluster assembly iron-binding protein IscA
MVNGHTNGAGYRREPELTVTREAAAWLKSRLSPDRARTVVLRLEFHVRDGQPVHALIPADRTRPSDHVYHLQGITFVIDPKTFELVRGSEIDVDPHDPDAGISVSNPNIQVQDEGEEEL